VGLDCLLIADNQVITPYPVYPLGIAHLAGALEAAGHRPYQFDLLCHGGLKALARRLSASSPDLVALSIRNLDTVDSTTPDNFIPKAQETMALIRRFCRSPVVLGGPAFSILPEVIMERFQADYGVVGEGEIILPWLADCLESGAPPHERIFRAKPADAPWQSVQYDSSIANYYLGWGGMLNVQTKRGCPHRCAYCSYPGLEGNRLRLREPESVADDVMRITRDMGARYVFFTDAVFNDGQDHCLQVAEALIRSGNTAPWCAFFRPQNLSRDALKLFKRAGLVAMEMGTDAAADQTLSALNKGFTFDDVMATNDIAASLGISCAHFIIFGGPDEDDGTVREGLANLERLKQCVVFAFTGIRILPSTPIYKRVLREGALDASQTLLEPVFYFSPKIRREELEHQIKTAWSGRIDRVYPCSIMDKRIRYLHERGHVGPMWDMLICRPRTK